MASYQYVIANTYAAGQNAYLGDFRDSYMDDTAWWAPARIDAYDLTGNTAYLTTAEDDASYLAGYWDSTCGGGIWWSSARTYKNAIANELYLYLNAALHNRISGDTTYLARAMAEESWFLHSGMINGQNPINDGLTINSGGTCANNGAAVWTYNQGVILSGLTELYKATGDASVLNEAVQLAGASTSSPQLNPVSATAPKGELADPSASGADEPTFKGVYVRGVSALNSVASGAPYGCYRRGRRRRPTSTTATPPTSTATCGPVRGRVPRRAARTSLRPRSKEAPSSFRTPDRVSPRPVRPRSPARSTADEAQATVVATRVSTNPAMMMATRA